MWSTFGASRTRSRASSSDGISLATELDVAPYTVARAYRQLEDLGVIETHGRNGTLVSTHGDTTQQQAQVAARAFADRIHGLGYPTDLALELAKAALDS